MTTMHETRKRTARRGLRAFLRHDLGMAAFAVAALTLGAMAAPLPAAAFWSPDNVQPFDPDVNPPHPYDPSAVGRLGVEGSSGWSSGCYWSREQVYVAGRLVWRPLQVCPYPPD